MVNKFVQIKRIMILLSLVGSVPLCAMDNKKPPRRSPRLAEKRLAEKMVQNALVVTPGVTKRKLVNATEQPLKKKAKGEFLIYPEDIDFGNIKLPAGVAARFGNMFLVSKGFDGTLIHKTVVPQRVPDFPCELIQ